MTTEGQPTAQASSGLVSRYWARARAEVPTGRYFWMFVLSAGLDRFASVQILPFMSLFYRQRFGLSMSAIGVLNSLGDVVSLLLAVPAGYMADRFGRKAAIVVSRAATAANFLLLTLMRNFGQLLGLNFVGQVLRSPGHSAGDSLIADLVEERKRNTAYGIMRVVANVDWIIGPILGGHYIETSQNYNALLYAAAALRLVALALLVLLVPETRRADLPPPNVVSLHGFLNRYVATLCIAVFFCMLAYFQMYTILPVTAKEKGLPETLIGTLFAASGVTVLLLQLPTSLLVSRADRKKALIVSIALLGLGAFGLGVFGTFWGMVGSIGVLTLGESVFFPKIMAVVTEIAPEAELDTYLGTFGLAFGLGHILSTLLGGVVMDLTGSSSMPFLVSPLYTVISIVAMMSFRRRDQTTGETLLVNKIERYFL